MTCYDLMKRQDWVDRIKAIIYNHGMKSLLEDMITVVAEIKDKTPDNTPTEYLDKLTANLQKTLDEYNARYELHPEE
jgi:hypothetical protein